MSEGSCDRSQRVIVGGEEGIWRRTTSLLVVEKDAVVRDGAALVDDLVVWPRLIMNACNASPAHMGNDTLSKALHSSARHLFSRWRYFWRSL